MGANTKLIEYDNIKELIFCTENEDVRVSMR